MASPLVSILIPHLRTPANNQALAIALDCIATNTGMDYELIVEGVETRRDIYPVVNRMARRAVGDWIVFSNSDVFFAPNWLEALYAGKDENVIVAGVLVECGAIGVNTLNVHHNFGMTPEAFDRRAFEEWCEQGGEVPAGRGWLWPSLHHRQTFLDMGGYDSSRIQWPDPVDLDYWDRWERAGKDFRRMRSFAYHLQQWSFEEEQQKAVRHGG